MDFLDVIKLELLKPAIASISYSPSQGFIIFWNYFLTFTGLSSSQYESVKQYLITLDITKFDPIVVNNELTEILLGPFRSYIDTFGNIHISKVVLSHLFQNLRTSINLEVIDELAAISDESEQIKYYFSSLNQNQCTLYSGSGSSVFPYGVVSKYQDIRTVRTLIDWRPKDTEFKLLGTQGYWQHLSDHYGVPHYHVLRTFSELVAYFINNLKRSWTSIIKFKYDSLPAMSRIHYGARTFALPPLSDSQADTLYRLQLACLYPCPWSLDSLELVTSEDIVSSVFKLVPASPNPTYYLTSIPVTQEILDASIVLGFPCSPERYHVEDFADLVPSVALPVSSISLNEYPIGAQLDIELLKKYITFPQPDKYSSGFRFDFPLFEGIVMNIPNPAIEYPEATALEQHLQSHGSMPTIRASLRPQALLKTYFDNDLTYSYVPDTSNTPDNDTEHNLLGVLLSVILSSAQQTPSFDSDTGIFSGPLSVLTPLDHTNSITDLPASYNLLSILRIAFENEFAGWDSFSISVINSPYRLVSAERFCRSRGSFRYFITGSTGFGTSADLRNLAFESNTSVILAHVDCSSTDWPDIEAFIDYMRSIPSSTLFIATFNNLDNVWAGIVANLPTRFNQNADHCGIFPPLFEQGSTGGITIVVGGYGNDCYMTNIGGNAKIPSGIIRFASRSVSIPQIGLRTANPELDLDNFDLPPGTFIRGVFPYQILTDGISLLLNLCDHIHITKFQSSDAYYLCDGVSSATRRSILERVGHYRTYTRDVNFNALICSPYSFSVPQPTFSAEELLTAYHHSVLYFNGEAYRKVDQRGFIDFGSGAYANISCSDGPYIAVDSFPLPAIDCPDVRVLNARIDLSNPNTLPFIPGVTRACAINSIFFVDTLTGAQALNFAWLAAFFTELFNTYDQFYFNLPVCDVADAPPCSSYNNLAITRRPDGIQAVGLKLSRYDPVVCFGKGILVYITAIAQAVGATVTIHYPSMTDLIAVRSIYGRDVTTYELQKAQMLGILVPLVHIKK